MTRTILCFAAGFSLLTIAGPVAAEGCWDCEPEAPTEEPEPEPEPDTPTTPPDRSTDSWVDRHGALPTSRPLPCCIRDGKLAPKPTLFMSVTRALQICEKAKATGQALIYECPDVVSPESLK